MAPSIRFIESEPCSARLPFCCSMMTRGLNGATAIVGAEHEALLRYDRQSKSIIRAVAETSVETMRCYPNLQPAVLAIVAVGEGNPTSAAYLQATQLAARCARVTVRVVQLHEHASCREVSAMLHHLNEDSTCHGIALQLPLPHHLNDDEQPLLAEIAASKDVDGLGRPPPSTRPTDALDTATLPGACRDLVSALRPAPSNVALLGIPESLTSALKTALERDGHDCACCPEETPTGEARAMLVHADLLVIGRPRFDLPHHPAGGRSCLTLHLGEMAPAAAAAAARAASPTESFPTAMASTTSTTSACSMTPPTCLTCSDGLALRVGALRLSRCCDFALVQQGFLEEAKPSSCASLSYASPCSSLRSSLPQPTTEQLMRPVLGPLILTKPKSLPIGAGVGMGASAGAGASADAGGDATGLTHGASRQLLEAAHPPSPILSAAGRMGAFPLSPSGEGGASLLSSALSSPALGALCRVAATEPELMSSALDVASRVLESALSRQPTREETREDVELYLHGLEASLEQKLEKIFDAHVPPS